MDAFQSSQSHRLLQGPLLPLLAVAFAGRTISAILPITLLLSLAHTDGYARAGTLSGSSTLALALLVPWRARLVDRLGTRAIHILAACSMTAMTAAATTVATRGPWPLILALVITAQTTAPPLNADLRSSWRHLVPDDHHLKAVHTADSVLEEAGFVAAPLTAGTLVWLLDATHAYEATVAAYLTTLTTYLLMRHRIPHPDRQPEPTPHAPAATTPAPATRPPARHALSRWLGPLASPRILLIMAPLLVMGCVFGGTGILVPATTQHLGQQSATGPLLAAISTGGVIGGLLYSRLTRTPTPTWTTYRLLLAGFTLPACLLPLAIHLWLLGLLLLLSGLMVTPLFITAYLLVDTHADPTMRTETNAWVTASTDLTNGITAALTGVLCAADHYTLARTLLAACAAAGLLLAAAPPRITRTGPEHPQPAPNPHPARASSRP